jgi:sugar lactone lactonase YvrE
MVFTVSTYRSCSLAIVLAGLFVAGNLPGQVYVSDDNASNNGIVYQVSITGTAITYASALGIPEGLAFDGSGNLYVSNGQNSSLLKVTPGGAVSTLATGTGAQAVVVGPDGNIYVANGSNAINQVTPGGAVTTFASGFAEVYGLAFGSNGNLYATDGNAGAGILYQITPGGVVSPFATGVGYADGLAVDGAGNFYVSDITGGRIFEVSSGGAVSTFLTGLPHGPRGLSFDPNTGLLYYTVGYSSANGASLYDANSLGQQTFVAGGLTDANFTTVMSAAVPEPSAFAGLLGLGALGLVLFRRRSARCSSQ